MPKAPWQEELLQANQATLSYPYYATKALYFMFLRIASYLQRCFLVVFSSTVVATVPYFGLLISYLLQPSPPLKAASISISKS